ncbi:hypothetical protein ACLVWQ_31760 (plasmid) [Streptomyces sp. CWNU-52B]
MTGNHEGTSITRRRVIALTGGTATAAAGGLALVGYQAVFASSSCS